MRKPECEAAIRSLCNIWAGEQSNADLVHPSFSKFTSWLAARKHSHYLEFKSLAGPRHDAQLWFDDELEETRLRAAVADMPELLDQLTAAAARAGSVSLRHLVIGLERHSVTNDELEAIRKLKEAGPHPDAPLLGYVRTVFAKHRTGADGWPTK